MDGEDGQWEGRPVGFDGVAVAGGVVEVDVAE